MSKQDDLTPEPEAQEVAGRKPAKKADKKPAAALALKSDFGVNGIGLPGYEAAKAAAIAARPAEWKWAGNPALPETEDQAAANARQAELIEAMGTEFEARMGYYNAALQRGVALTCPDCKGMSVFHSSLAYFSDENTAENKLPDPAFRCHCGAPLVPIFLVPGEEKAAKPTKAAAAAAAAVAASVEATVNALRKAGVEEDAVKAVFEANGLPYDR